MFLIWGRLRFLDSMFSGVVPPASPFLLLVLRFFPQFSLHVVCFLIAIFIIIILLPVFSLVDGMFD